MIVRAIREAGRLTAGRPWMTAAILVAAFAIAGLAVAASGVIPVRASAGHWAVTEWLVHFAKERSVVTHSIFIEAPPLDDWAGRVRGAAHYDRGCSPCHGSVGGRTPRVPEAMLPPPPYLPPLVTRWSPEQLFYIVKHGLKLTGMPAWPATGRDDEVWDVVAFLQTLPRLDTESYRQLARGTSGHVGGGNDDLPPLRYAAAEDRSTPDVVRAICAPCHGLDGGGRGGAFPVLAAQKADYMALALRAYRDSRRHSGVMEPVAVGLSESEAAGAVGYYAALPRPRAAASAAESVERGQAIAARGLPERKIPPCVECHGPSLLPKNPAYPVLAGQPAQYLARQLLLLQRRARGGSEYVHLMQAFASRLREAEIAAVAAYFSSVDAHPAGPDADTLLLPPVAKRLP
jgi:cytochrome c553